MSSQALIFGFTCLTLTIGFSLIIASSDYNNVMENWNTKRCELVYMFSASLFKPATNTKSSIEFATDNFRYCTTKIINDVLQTGFAPFYAILKEQMNSLGVLSQVINSVRGSLAKATGQFSKILDDRYKVFIAVALQFVRVWHQFKSAMSRMSAMMISILYMGLTTVVGLLNVYDFVMKVVMIIMIILVIMVIFLFFIMLPVIPVILTTIGVLAGVGVSVAGADAFCLHPMTRVKYADGSWNYIKNVKLGDVLASSRHTYTIKHSKNTNTNKNRVEGILKVNGADTNLVCINGIYMSKSHRILYNNTYCLAKDHPDAIPIGARSNELYCLNTSEHSIQCFGLQGIECVSDWQEVTTEEGEMAWIKFVNTVLNNSDKPSVYPTSVPLLSPKTYIEVNSVPVPINDIKIGHNLVDENGNPNIVLGIYRGLIQTSDSLPEKWMSDGVWIQSESNTWYTNSVGVRMRKDTVDQRDTISSLLINTPIETEGVFLVTSTGVFTVIDQKHIVVRDFTEVGIQNIEASYSMLDTHC